MLVLSVDGWNFREFIIEFNVNQNGIVSYKEPKNRGKNLKKINIQFYW